MFNRKTRLVRCSVRYHSPLSLPLFRPAEPAPDDSDSDPITAQPVGPWTFSNCSCWCCKSSRRSRSTWNTIASWSTGTYRTFWTNCCCRPTNGTTPTTATSTAGTWNTTRPGCWSTWDSRIELIFRYSTCSKVSRTARFRDRYSHANVAFGLGTKREYGTYARCLENRVPWRVTRCIFWIDFERFS